MKINVDDTIKEFKDEFLKGCLKKDDLTNSSEIFNGKLEQDEFNKFVEFSKTPLFNKILEL